MTTPLPTLEISTEPEQEATITSEQLLRLGLSPRRLDHWRARGYLRALNPRSGCGTVSRYPATELDVARTMLRLADAGLTVEAAHRVARGGELGPGLTLLIDGGHPTTTAQLIDDLQAFATWLNGIVQKSDAQDEPLVHGTADAIARELRRVLNRHPLAYARAAALDPNARTVVEWLVEQGRLDPAALAL